MSTNRIEIYISGSGWRPTAPFIYIAGSGWKTPRAIWVNDGSAWKHVFTFVAPSAADNSIVAALVGGALSHTINFQWTSYNEQTYLGGRLHIFLDGSEITILGFSPGTNHSQDYTLPDTYGTTGGTVTAKVAYLPSGGSIEGTQSPASNGVSVMPWL